MIRNLLTFQWTKTLIFALIVCIKMMRIALRFLRMFFRNLVTVTTKELLFMFNNKFYKQIDGVAMGSPLGPALASIFMCNFENKWLKDCPHSLKPVFYRRYVDDIFVLFSSIELAEKIKKYLSSKHPNINFSL